MEPLTKNYKNTQFFFVFFFNMQVLNIYMLCDFLGLASSVFHDSLFSKKIRNEKDDQIRMLVIYWVKLKHLALRMENKLML